MYVSEDIAERIKALAKERNVSMKQLLADVGLGFNTMSNMKTSIPKADNLAKIADYLGCSVDYLLGREEQEKPPVKIPEGLDEDRAKLAAMVLEMSPEQVRAMRQMIEAMLSQNNE